MIYAVLVALFLAIMLMALANFMIGNYGGTFVMTVFGIVILFVLGGFEEPPNDD